MEGNSDAGRKLSAVQSVCQRRYQVAFSASKCGDSSNYILSLHGGLSLNIQKQLEIKFKCLVKEASHEGHCSIIQSQEETIPSNHPVSIQITDALAAASSHDDQTSNTRTGMESAAHVDTVKVECTSEFDASLPEYLPTDDTELSRTTDDDPDESVEYSGVEKLDASQNQKLQIKPEALMDLEVEHDQTQTWSNPVPDPIFERLGGKKKLIHHLRKDTGEKRYACTECPYGTPKLINLRRHMMTHTGEKPFACPKCPFRCARKGSLQRHILTHTDEKPFACPECPYRSVYKQVIQKHILTHTGEKPFACPECPFRASHQSNLKSHILTHSGEKPFACPQCPYRSKYKHAVQSHILTHTGEKPFACPQCPYRAATQSNMKIHMLTHIGEKPFACPECPYRTKYKSDLKRHILTHTGEKTVCLP